MKGNQKKRTSKVKGFTLVELTVAMAVLAIGILGGMMMVIIGASRDNSNRVDTTATNVAQSVLEQISGAPTNGNPVLTMTDCLQTDPTTSTLKISTAPGGATLLSNGDVNFSADSATTLNNNQYQMNFTVCGNNGLQTTYDVRWHIDLVGAGGFGKLVTVSALQPFVANQSGLGQIRPITLRTIVSM